MLTKIAVAGSDSHRPAPSHRGVQYGRRGGVLRAVCGAQAHLRWWVALPYLPEQRPEVRARSLRPGYPPAT
eukprot:COSAG01_NODE_9459_length_2440_cov_14.780956_3_plen_70_part_01